MFLCVLLCFVHDMDTIWIDLIKSRSLNSVDLSLPFKEWCGTLDPTITCMSLVLEISPILLFSLKSFFKPLKRGSLLLQNPIIFYFILWDWFQSSFSEMRDRIDLCFFKRKVFPRPFRKMKSFHQDRNFHFVRALLVDRIFTRGSENFSSRSLKY